MYTFDVVKQALEQEPLSEALLKLELYATSMNQPDLAQWANRERSGYEQEFLGKDLPEYRNTVVTWYDQNGRPFPFVGDLVYINTWKAQDGVEEMEAKEKEGYLMSDPNLQNMIRQRTGVSLQGYKVMPEEIRRMLKAIKNEALKRLSALSGHQTPIRLAYSMPNFAAHITDLDLVANLQSRWVEANKVYAAEGYLSTIILLGSILEGVLLHDLQRKSAEAFASKAAPTKKGTVVQHVPSWKLTEMIQVATDLKWFGPELRDFATALREYRNLVHPAEQLNASLVPTLRTCEVCWAATHAALEHLFTLP